MSDNPLLQEALKRQAPFSVEDLSHKSDLAEEILEESNRFFWSFDNNGERQFVSRSSFFRESNFSIHFSKEEIEGLYLVAPGRFIPFSYRLLPLKVEGRFLPVTERKISLKCLERVLSLDKGESLLRVLQDEKLPFLSSLQAASDMPIAVYDLSFLKERLHPGTHLELSISEDCLEGKLVQSDELCLDKVKLWCESMEKSFLGILREFGPFISVGEQLALAYYYGAASLRKGPSLALRDFIELSPRLEISDFALRRLVWYKGQLPADSQEALNRASAIKQKLTLKVSVCSAFYWRLPEKIRLNFKIVDESCERPSIFNKDLDALVLRCALWIENSQKRLSMEISPVEELLMFESIFEHIQQLCSLCDKNGVNPLFSQDFEKSVMILSQMLQEVCELLQIYYSCELS